MTSRERWQNILRRQPVDQIPCDFWATSEVKQRLCEHLGCNDYWQMIDRLQIDASFVVEPDYIGPALQEGYNIWGVQFKPIDYGSGVYEEVAQNPLAQAKTIDDFKAHPWPKADWFDYSQIKSSIDQHAHRPIRAGYLEPFMHYCWMRGMEQAMMDMVTEPEFVDLAFDRMFEFATEKLQRILEVSDGRVDIVHCAEDLGGQTGPLFSLNCFRRFHKLRFNRYMDLAHQAGCVVFYHTDGAARDFIPDLIEIGVDILNPIQWKCPGMDRVNLKRDFGSRLVFHGGVDNQHVLPHGSVEEVRSEVLTCFETMGLGGGYICAPCHNIQPVTPIENILTMYQTIKDIASDPKYTGTG